MSDKIKRNLSLTDLNFHMDLDIENESADRAGRAEKAPVPPARAAKEEQEEAENDTADKIGNTLDYYRDEMSKKEVEKILESFERTDSEPKEKSGPETDRESLRTADEADSFDYEYMLNLLRESKKEQAPIEETHERSEPKPSGRVSRRRDESLKAFKIFRLSAFAVFALFLMGFAVLAYNMNKANNEIAVFKADIDKLKEDTKDYEELKIENQGLQQENEELEKENNEFRNRLEQNSGNSSGEEGTAEGDSDPQPQEESGPTKYTIKSGDSLWKISERFYGDGSLYTEIKAANNIEKDTDIYSGMEITIPDI